MIKIIPKNKSQEFSWDLSFYSDGLFSVKVESKPSIRTAIPSKTMKVWITVFIPIYYLLLYYFAILGAINFALFIMPRLNAMLKVCSYW